MICKTCGVKKPAYHFFTYTGRYDKSFFVTGRQPGVCWECAAPYRCIKCGQVKGTEHFRVMGRICHSCKPAKTGRRDVVHASKRGFQGLDVISGVEAHSVDFMGFMED